MGYSGTLVTMRGCGSICMIRALSWRWYWLTRRESGRSCGHKEDLGKKLETKKYRNVKERNSLLWSISRFRTTGFCYVTLMAQFCRIFTEVCRIVKSMSKFPSGVMQPCNLKGGAVKVHFPFAVEIPQWLRRYNVSCSY